MVYTLAQEQKAGRYGGKNFVQPKSPLPVSAGVLRLADGLGVDGGAADHPDVVVRVGRTELVEGRHNLKSLA